CNESQERYVLAVAPENLAKFEELCKRERAQYAVIGEATEERHLTLTDEHFDNKPIDLPLDVLLGKPPKMHRDVVSKKIAGSEFNISTVDAKDAADRLLRLPAIAEKTFLITIGDRSVTGMVARDQMVGPWQIPVADVAVTTASLDSYYGEAMSLGERTPIALLNYGASARMAVAESITNIAATNIGEMNRIKMSANWMAAAGHPGEDAGLYEAVKAVGEELCPALDITIPVGKDSMSMKTKWQDDSDSEEKSVTSPLSLVITAFARVEDVRDTVTPQLRTDKGDTSLILIDLGNKQNRMGASCLAQVYNQLGTTAPDVDSPELLKGFFNSIQALVQDKKLLAYHDRSDGGLFTTVAEMAFAGKAGVNVQLDGLGADSTSILFSEELGAVVQVSKVDEAAVLAVLADNGLAAMSHVIGSVNTDDKVSFSFDGEIVLENTRTYYRTVWAETTFHMQSMRDNPECAKQEFDAKFDADDKGLNVDLSFDLNEDVAAPFIAKDASTGIRPKVAILREQGVNSHIEMAAAFNRAGFDAIDVHMSDLQDGRLSLEQFKGLVACGGFSYGDVLGAGEGWAKSILFNDKLSAMFKAFFHREDTFSLGVCNGCQMMSNLRSLIPGADHWPRFVTNKSERFEARFSLVEIQESDSVFFAGMAGSRMPIAVSHGEGRAEFASEQHVADAVASGTVAMKYVDNKGVATEVYPANPNGSPQGITSLTTSDGRVTIMMPHPERVFRSVTNSWHPDEWLEDSPWMRMFRNARKWVG
ncbi:MAG: phosphoribosylformylglycinamidine synthase, partial [Gammaproteobacteria bacterium]|nr:phosphoribosylformylglycinamidine synthase [Gammaproteobacteria bacterium]